MEDIQMNFILEENIKIFNISRSIFQILEIEIEIESNSVPILI